jgi:hypothetical protein
MQNISAIFLFSGVFHKNVLFSVLFTQIFRAAGKAPNYRPTQQCCAGGGEVVALFFIPKP